MPTNLNNQASVTYSYSAGGTGSANSNMTTTTLLDEYSLSAAKSSLLSSYRPGENLTYMLNLENNGSGALYNVTVTDDLGAAGGTAPLSYVNGSAVLLINSMYYTINPTVGDNGLTFVLPVPLQPQAVAYIIYVATVDEDLPSTTGNIVNTATITANEGSTSGNLLTVNPSPTATVTAESYADVSIYKEADKATVNTGDTLTYTFTLTNTGNETAEGVRMTDVLPESFSVSSIQSITNGVVTTYAAQDYTIGSGNELVLPAEGAPVTISVPAATDDGAGITTIVVTGTV